MEERAPLHGASKFALGWTYLQPRQALPAQEHPFTTTESWCRYQPRSGMAPGVSALTDGRPFGQPDVDSYARHHLDRSFAHDLETPRLREWGMFRSTDAEIASAFHRKCNRGRIAPQRVAKGGKHSAAAGVATARVEWAPPCARAGPGQASIHRGSHCQHVGRQPQWSHEPASMAEIGEPSGESAWCFIGPC